MLKKFLVNYFGFNKQQRNGVFVLMLICLSILAIRISLPYIIKPDNIQVLNLPLYERKLDSMQFFSKKAGYNKKEKTGNKKFPFNPNTVAFDELMRLGFTKKTAKTFIKYRSKGAVFRQKLDLKKVYGIKGKFYTELEPYIIFDEKPKRIRAFEKETKISDTAVNIKNTITKADGENLKSETNELVEPKNGVHEKFSFNPNVVTYDELIQLGLSKKTAKTFIKYRSKGAVFRKKSDLKKVYGIDEKLFDALEPYIILEDISVEKKADSENTEIKVLDTTSKVKHSKSRFDKEVHKPKKQIVFEINSVDSLTLIEVQGINPSFAHRILKYKSLLGGYSKAEQLKEVFGFSAEMFENIKEDVRVDTSEIQKINLSKASFKEINKHPYFTYEITKEICSWRKKSFVNYTSLKEIIKNEGKFRQVLPYVIFE